MNEKSSRKNLSQKNTKRTVSNIIAAITLSTLAGTSQAQDIRSPQGSRIHCWSASPENAPETLYVFGGDTVEVTSFWERARTDPNHNFDYTELEITESRLSYSAQET
jgi:hypothetical protein